MKTDRTLKTSYIRPRRKVQVGYHKECAICGERWNVSIYDKRKGYIYPHCESGGM